MVAVVSPVPVEGDAASGEANVIAPSPPTDGPSPPHLLGLLDPRVHLATASDRVHRGRKGLDQGSDKALCTPASTCAIIR